MRIVNPIYDAAFKYLMEDLDIATGLIGRIINQDIITLSLQPQEHIFKSEKYLVKILRIDFKAIIKTEEGERKKVLIEIQKGKKDTDIIRFRRYLGKNYREPDNIITDSGETEKQALPIIPIYFWASASQIQKHPL